MRLVAEVTDTIAVRIRLIGIQDQRAVVRMQIRDAIAVVVLVAVIANAVTVRVADLGLIPGKGIDNISDTVPIVVAIDIVSDAIEDVIEPPGLEKYTITDLVTESVRIQRCMIGPARIAPVAEAGIDDGNG